VVGSPDTIAASASAPGKGAVGVIRVSGPLVPQIAAGLLGGLPAPRQAKLSSFLGAQGETLDEGIALYFPAPRSYTGEHVLEIQGHGGVLIVDMLLQRLLELGCRMARPGEFSERAFLNGKIDIAAVAVRHLRVRLACRRFDIVEITFAHWRDKLAVDEILDCVGFCGHARQTANACWKVRECEGAFGPSRTGN